MIYYPVKRDTSVKPYHCNILDAKGNYLLTTTTDEVADVVVNALNAMNEFPFPHVSKFWDIVNWYKKYIDKE